MLECDSLPLQLQSSRHYQEIRDRLKRPPNAVQDRPIHLNHPKGIDGRQALINARQAKAAIQEAKKQAELDSLAELLKRQPMDIARDWLVVSTNDAKMFKYPPRFFDEIIATVGAYFGVSWAGIIGPRRNPFYVIPRQFVCYFARNFTRLSYPQIAKRLGGRDHSTVVHSFDKVNKLAQIEGPMKVKICELTGIFERKLELWRAMAE